MVCEGRVVDGKVELEPGVCLPEGTRVHIQPIDETWMAGTIQPPARTSLTMTHEEWLAELDLLSRRIDGAWKSPKSALEILAETRR